LGFALVTWQWLRAEIAGQKLADRAKELEVKTYALHGEGAGQALCQRGRCGRR